MIRKNTILTAGKFQKLLAAVVVLAGLAVFPATAQDNRSVADEFRITFPVNKSILDREYRYNAQAFARLDSLLAVRGDVYVDSVVVVSKSSPEGRYSGNVSLSERRSLAIYDYIAETHPELISRVRYSAQRESWDEFRQMLLDDPTLSSYARERALAIIDADMPSDAKKARLYQLPEYQYYLKYYFPAIRFSAIVVMFDRAAIEGPQVPVQETSGLLQEDFTVPVEEIELSRPRLVIPPLTQRRMLAAVKTNLLYDVVTVLNFEVEVPIADRYSVMVEDVFPWWETGNKYCLQHWEMGPELRFWFRSWRPGSMDKMLGWFVGAYGMSSRYDIQFDTKIDYQGEYWSAGLTAGYVMPFKKGWLHDALRARLEFSLSAGYLQTDYRHYLPTDSYDMLIRDKYNVGTATYIGPTKAKVSLVVPIRTQIRERR